MNYGHGYSPKNKYNAHKGGGFDSRKEQRRFQELRLLERAGVIDNLRTQVKYVLIPTQREESTEVFTRGKNKGKHKPGRVIEKEVSYWADFTYHDINTDREVVEDVKGYKGSEAYKLFVIKRKLMLWRYGIRIREV